MKPVEIAHYTIRDSIIIGTGGKGEAGAGAVAGAGCLTRLIGLSGEILWPYAPRVTLKLGETEVKSLYPCVTLSFIYIRQ